ncbi:MAG: F0F1 ATP synthase subunit alpha [Planctomycetota bacterium]|nr:MAG: F0F1 ATP synthase subunit alpha [Planctomycetota bacterium]
MSGILQEIEDQIKSIKFTTGKTNVGNVKQIGDGVAKIDGLTDTMYNEMVEFASGVTGLVLNLEETEVGVVILGDGTKVKEGEEVKTTGKLLQLPVSEKFFGRVVNVLGQPIDGKGEIESDTYYPIEKIAPGIIARQSVDTPVQTGIMGIDAMIPVGRGQRELIIGDRSTGKTTIALDTIINQSNLKRQAEQRGDENFKNLFCIYVAIGQKLSNVALISKTLEEKKALDNTALFVASASDSATDQYLVPFAATALGEYMMDKGHDVLIVYDDLTKHAAAYRQISLILKRPSGREAYPGDVFYLHSRLLERSCRLSEANGGGSITSLPIIETQAGDVSAYIPTNVISITDGQIFLETDLFYQGIRPAINVGLSVSRVGGAAQKPVMKKVAGKIKLELAQYRELAAFAQFGSDLDDKTQLTLDRGERIIELFKQNLYSPLGLEEQSVVLYAMLNNHLQDVSIDKIKEFQTKLTDYVKNTKPEINSEILSKGKLTDELVKMLDDVIHNFKQSFN